METFNLLISASSVLFRQGLGLLLASRRTTIVNEVCSLSDALGKLNSAGCACDILLCEFNGDDREFEALRAIKSEFPDLKVVVVSNRLCSDRLEMAVQAGVDAFLPTDISVDALRHALELVVLGEHIFATLKSLIQPRSASAGEVRAMTDRKIPLSVRERQVLGCLVTGQSNKTIARSLNMAEATVKVHLKTLLRKIEVRNRTQAAVWAMNNGQLIQTAAVDA